VIHAVVISAQARRDLKKLPMNIVDKLEFWISLVQSTGLEEVRKIPGFHDEPLRGERTGQRSIRLSKAYRAIYIVVKHEVRFAEVQEVNKHRY
jgi:toxin HigB-1